MFTFSGTSESVYRHTDHDVNMRQLRDHVIRSIYCNELTFKLELRDSQMTLNPTPETDLSHVELN